MLKKTTFISIVILTLVTLIIFAENIAQYTAYEYGAKILVDGKETNFTMPVVLINDRTYIPLRETAENLDINVEWLGEENKILLNSKINKDILLRLSIFPTSTPMETYVLDLYKNGKYEVTIGTRTCDDLSLSDYLEPSKTEVCYLTRREMERISELTGKITESDKTEKQWILDYWDVSILFNGNQYDYNLNMYSSEHIEELIQTLIEFSPMEIDLHRWA